MSKSALIGAAGAFVVAVFAATATGPAVAAPKCKNKANKFVACTDAAPRRKGLKSK